MTRYFNHAIFDEFLPADVHYRLLEYALENREGFVPNKIYGDDQGKVNTTIRHSFYLEAGLGDLRGTFSTAVKAIYPELLQRLALPEFAVAGLEIELAAHRNGSFFRPHVDTVRHRPGKMAATGRMMSLVYYFHVLPKPFSGGELAFAPLGGGPPLLIEPIDNRLVAFPSFAPHEVKPVVLPDDVFTKSRFAVNCWFHRTEPAAG